MANPSPFEAFPMPPAAPYIYDDPRICYDEPCFCYNGGFDLVCLFGDQGRRRRGGKSTSSTTTGRKSYPRPEVVELLFKTCVRRVNDTEFGPDERCEVRTYKYEKSVGVKIMVKGVGLKGKPVRLSDPSVRVSSSASVKRALGLEAGLSVSSSLNKVSPTVSSSLRFSMPRKIVVKKADE